jgi:hypothetical protein
MAQSYLIFDFGSNEEAAEQARITIDRWKQAFRLDKKVMMRFDRSSEDAEDGGERSGEDGGEKSGEDVSEKSDGGEPDAAKGHRAKKHANKKDAEEKDAAPEQMTPEQMTPERITLTVRLEFSDHERLSHQRWLARIPAEEPFKHAHPRVIESGNPEFAAVAEHFQGGAGRPHGFSSAKS